MRLLLYQFVIAIHLTCSKWDAGDGPVKDLYSIADNPQYALNVHGHGGRGAAVWILLTRHITDKEDFANNKEFITVLVYRTSKRQFYPYEPKPILEGWKVYK